MTQNGIVCITVKAFTAMSVCAFVAPGKHVKVVPCSNDHVAPCNSKMCHFLCTSHYLTASYPLSPYTDKIRLPPYFSHCLTVLRWPFFTSIKQERQYVLHILYFRTFYILFICIPFPFPVLFLRPTLLCLPPCSYPISLPNLLPRLHSLPAAFFKRP